MAKWPSGKAEACKAFTPGSNPGFASTLFGVLTIGYADVAQLVEHNLAKVGVAGSNPVVRSINFTSSTLVGLFCFLGLLYEKWSNYLPNQITAFCNAFRTATLYG